MDIFYDLFFDYTLRTVALGTAIIGLVSGALGCFAFLRKQSLLGDAISHATLPGVVLAFLLTNSKEPIVLIIGGILAGWLATLFIMAVVKNTRIKEDSALGISLSVFFGFGLVLMAYAQTMPNANQAGLNRFLFGQAAAIVERDVITMGILGLLTLGLMVLFWKELKIVSFDPAYAASLGLPVRWLEVMLTTLLVIAIVIGLQAVGVILMSAMVVAPAAAARQWTNRLGLMVFLAAMLGAVSGVGGAMISSLGSGLGTGPVIVLFVSGIVLVSLLVAPERGLVWSWLRQQRNRRRLQLETVLSDLYQLGKQHQDARHGHSVETLRMMSLNREGVERSLKKLHQQGYVTPTEADNWALTPVGILKAESILKGHHALPAQPVSAMGETTQEVTI